MSSRSSRPASRIPTLLGGCALVALCLCVIGLGSAGVWYYYRTPPVAAEPAVEYLLDASPRMALPSEAGTRLNVAQAVLAEIVRPANPQVTAGLRVFGTGALADACLDTQLVVPLALANQSLISDELAALQAGSAADAAMAEAMIAAIRDLTSALGPYTLVVVTGGADSCSAEAGQLIAAEAQNAGIELELFVVGYQVPPGDAQAIRGLIDQTPSAAYLEAQDENGLRAILKAIQQRVDNRGSLPLADILATARAVAATPAAAPTATPQPGVTLEAASQMVLEQVVLPDALDHEVVVFAWPETLQPTDSLAPYAYPAFGLPPEPIAIAAESWFFWIDDFPNGKFEHPNRYILVDRASGAVTLSDEAWWPVLNGVGLWLAPEGYWNADNWVFDNFAGRPQDRTASAAAQARLARLFGRTWLQGEGVGVGLVLNGWLPDQPGGADLAADAQGMLDALSGFGLTTTYLGPAQDFNPNRAGELNADSLRGALAQMTEQLVAGDTLLLYDTGHGGRSPEGGYFGAGVSAELLAAQLKTLDPGADVVVILDFSYSGGFIEFLLPYSDRIITAADAKTPAAFDVDHPSDPNPTDRGSEFTSGFVERWEALRANGETLQQTFDRAAATGRSQWEAHAALAYSATLTLDSNALRGTTFPQMVPDDAALVVAEPGNPEGDVFGLFLGETSFDSGNREHFGFIKLPTNPTIEVKKGSVIFDGPDPWVDVTGELLPDGAFTAEGTGTVAGNPNVLVVFKGTLTSQRLTGLYTLGADGQLPGGQSITYRVEAAKAPPGTAVPGVTPDPAAAAQETVETFVRNFVGSRQINTVDFLVARLDPAVLSVYGEKTCRATLEERGPNSPHPCWK